MANLFNSAKKNGVKKDTKPKEQKVRIKVNDPDFFNKIDRLQELQDNMKRDKAEADMISDEIKDLSKDEWVSLYEKDGKNPGTVMVESKNKLDVAQVMFVPSDKYISINEEKASSLTEKYGEGIVTENTTYAFDAEMVDKYGEILSTLITDSDEIAEDDKEKIIKAVTTFTIAKGTIDKMNQFKNGEKLYSVKEVMDEIRPIVALKNVEVISSNKND